MAPRGFRRLLRRDKSPAVAASTERVPSPPRLQTADLNSKPKSHDQSPLKANAKTSSSSALPSLWEQVYDSFVSSTDSPDLKSIAALLNDQSRTTSAGLEGHDNLKAGQNASSEWRLCTEVLQMAETERSKLEGDGLTSKLRRAYDEITTWVEKFIFIGDAVAQLDPVHVGLPWAGVRAILVISIQDQKTRADLVDGVAHLSKLICRYAVFEDVYLNRSAPVEDSVQNKLRSSLKALYLSIFRYLVQAVLQLKSSTTGQYPTSPSYMLMINDLIARIGRSIIMSDTMTKLYADIENDEEEVLAYEKMSIKAASHAQYMDVRLKLCTYEDHLESEKRKTICDWISKIDCHSQHREMRSRVSPNTGQWFLERSEYRTWLGDSNPSLLWLRGNAGTGKTSLISCVNESFLERSWLDSKEAFAYFYCSRTIGDSRQQDPQKILLSILRQLSSPQPGLPLKSPVVDEFKKETARGSQEANLPVPEIAILLDRLIKGHYEKVTIVVDALDECDANKRSQLLDVLTRLTYNGSGTTVKTLISSRDDPDISTHFASTPNLSITATDNEGDIARFVQRELQKRLLNRKASVNLRARVEAYLTHKANGVFRWVALQVDALCDSERVFSEADVDYLLTQLPATLEDTYTKILKDLDRLLPRGRECVENVLKLLMATETVLDMDTLLEALNVLSPPEQAQWDKKAVIKMAKGLVTNTGWEVTFAHLSVKEFLETTSTFHGEAPHALAAEACLKKYIQHHEPDTGSDNLQRYALRSIAWHMMKAGSLRQDPKLRGLILEFMQANEAKAFNLWDQDRSRIHSYDSSESYLWRPQDACLSSPAFPLFMICVYKLNDFLDLIGHDYRHRLDARNTRDQGLIEVAAAHSNLDALKRIHETVLVMCPSSIRSDTWVRGAAKADNLDVWQYTLDNVTNLSVQSAILRAATNEKLGEVMVRGLLNTAVSITEQEICEVLRECPSLETLKMVRSQAVSGRVSETMVEAAAYNPFLNPELTKLLVSEIKDFCITEGCFLSALSHRRFFHPTAAPGSKSGVVKFLLDYSPRCMITEEILCVALDNFSEPDDDGQYIGLLLEAWAGDQVTEDLLYAVVENTWLSPEILTNGFRTVLEYGSELKISLQVAEKALAKSFATITEHPNLPSLLEENFYHALETTGYWETVGQIINVLTKRKSFLVTDYFLQRCASELSKTELERIIDIPRVFPISWEIICAADMGRTEFTDSNLELLLDKLSKADRYVNEERVVMLLQPGHNRANALRALAHRFGKLPVTASTVSAAGMCDIETLEYLLSHHNGALANLLTDDLLLIALEEGRIDVVELIKRQRPGLEINEGFLRAGLRSPNRVPIMKSLLSLSNRCPIDAVMLEKIGEYMQTDPELVDYVLALPDVAALPETVTKLQTQRQQLDKELQEEPQEKSREESQGAPEESQRMSDMQEIFREVGGYAIERLGIGNTAELGRRLRAWKGSDSDIVRLIELVAGVGKAKFCIEYLLRRFPGTPITREALCAAIVNERALMSLVEYLLDLWKQPLDTELLCLAAGNKYLGTQLVGLLLGRCASGEPIDQNAVILASLGNPYCGRSLLDLFLQRDPNISVTQEMIQAASGNSVLKSGLLQKLLQHTMNKSADNGVDAVLKGIESLPGGIRDSLFMAVCYGEDDVLDLLLSRGVSLSIVSGELGTVLNVAVYAQNYSAVKKLLEEGSDVESRSAIYDSPLITACNKEDSRMIRILLEHGAAVDSVESHSTGRTPLHMALEGGSQIVYQQLISAGASLTKVDLCGMTALHHAVVCLHSTLGLEEIIQCGVPVDAEDSHGWTALHWAARAGLSDHVSVLLAAGASKDKADASGRTPYDVAEFCGHFHLRTKLVLSEHLNSAVGDVGDNQETLCQACFLNIRGPLYKCRSCKAYNLCFRCIEDVKAIHDTGHEFDEIPG